MNLKNIWKLSFVIIIVYLSSCKPETIGFLNDNMRYNVSELQAVQGSSVTTNPLVANGSSTPMSVKLVAVRNKVTGEIVNDFLTEQEYSVYLGQVGSDINTMDQLSALIGTKKSPAISVNGIGGKVVLTPATESVPAGLYTLDIDISNISGQKSYKDVLNINLIELKPDSIFSKSATSSGLSSETDVRNLASTDYSTTIQYIPGNENKIIFMWLDKNGKAFNPKQGEVIKRASLPSFADWSPFYPEQLTDTSIVYQYPYFKGLSYPVKTTVRVGESNFTNLTSNYRINGAFTSLGRNINTSLMARFYKPGIHIVKFKVKNLNHRYPFFKTTTITKNVILPFGAGYASTKVDVNKTDILNALKISEQVFLDGLLKEVSFYATQADGTRNATNTANAPGMWLDELGNTVNWGGRAKLYSEYNKNDWAFYVGQFPDKNVVGEKMTIKQSFVYDDGQYFNEILYVLNVIIQ
ncbi:DUF4859 domain-containing protein [Sphingobacterium bovistauri]|uniref:DUF4859 domain-containing protein n=1 Tax=Sphingobacterium bovistauri TaxID=2781959 RepID=A0ABS7Z1H4_9SPHI|nr:DUF4859 domain-containing protein [Sphingobacterium bovistauri]MCA5003828.1 DUF4859 domain-containing protein [Sphingobacterium bovistauri]